MFAAEAEALVLNREELIEEAIGKGLDQFIREDAADSVECVCVFVRKSLPDVTSSELDSLRPRIKAEMQRRVAALSAFIERPTNVLLN